MSIIHLRTASSIRATLSSYHPVFIEGPASRNDHRDSPQVVAKHVVANLRRHWNNNTEDDDDRVVDEKLKVGANKPIRPLLLIIQGDPYTPHGISAITRIVAQTLQIERCLVCLDENIDRNHASLADRENVRYEIQYSNLLDILNDDFDSTTKSNNNQSSIVNRLTNAIDDKIASKNVERNKQGMDKLDTWYRQYALLQEVTKATIKKIAGEITVAHTTADIDRYSVTSVYEVGIDLGLIDSENDMVYYYYSTFES